uniref:ABC transporter domain-containing protein n=1 Tax=Haemonchus contortus TaxID=6289 RepID=A0A7I4YKW4_HAECO
MQKTDETASLLSADTQSVTSYGGTSSADDALDSVEPVTLSWRDLRVSVAGKGRQLLHGVSGLAPPGKLLALMGASGAGKTTLLNTFLNRNLKGLRVEGRVEINGNVIGREITAISGYAQQEEMFVGTLTVQEYLSIQARLRTNLSPERREKRVNVILAQLGLTKCQNNRIGVAGVRKGISGGEARRLTFACELLSNPAILFCDEPTTGLDSFMAEHVVVVLSKLARNGRTVVCTIHQPASQLFLMFDRVMFLAGGRTAFFGTPRECIEFFEQCGHPCPHNYNPADLIIHTLAVAPHEEEACRVRITTICDSFENGTYGKALRSELAQVTSAVVPRGRRRVNFGIQVAALLHRYFLDNLRNPTLARAKFLQKFVMGIFVGLLYLQTPLTFIGIGNINGALFYLVCELTYASLFGILTCIPGDYPLVVREYHDGIYYVISYFIARTLSYLPLFSLDGLLMMYVCYWMVGFSSSVTQVLFATIISLLIEQSSCAFGMMLACVAPNYPVGASVAGPILTLLSLTGGLYANVGSLPVYISWIQYLSWFRYAEYGFEALAINQWNEVNDANSTRWNNQRRDEVLAQYSFKADRFILDQLLMVAFIFVFYLIGYIGLSIRIYRSR